MSGALAFVRGDDGQQGSSLATEPLSAQRGAYVKNDCGEDLFGAGVDSPQAKAETHHESEAETRRRAQAKRPTEAGSRC